MGLFAQETVQFDKGKAKLTSDSIAALDALAERIQEELDASEEAVESCKKMKAETEQDQIKIRELQKQIEQLKNIENIIKNREL